MNGRPASGAAPRAAPLAICLLGLATLAACSPTYVLRAGWEEAKILANRRPITEVVHDTAESPQVRGKLRLVQDSRDFAIRSLGLQAGDSFRSYAELARDTLALNVSAVPEFELRWLTWWFPIVGHVPYRGFFNFEQAHAEARRLADEGNDVSIRPVSAFSTLGWLPDPVLSTTLRLDSVALVATVVHEITHTTFFPSGQAHFNESFANFVGHRGAIAFYCEAVADESRCRAANDRWEDTRVFGRFFHSLLEPLRAAYAEEGTPDEMRRRKREIFEQAARRYDEEVRPRLRAGEYGELDPDRLNNAWVLSRLLYYTRLDDFERLYQRQPDLRTTVAVIIEASRDSDPWNALDLLVEADP